MNLKLRAFLLMLALMIACTGCGSTPEVTEVTVPAEIPNTTQETHLEQTTEAPEVTETIAETTQAPAPIAGVRFGTFMLDSSGQFSNCICRLKQMDPDLLLFELDMMEGSESADQTFKSVIAGTVLLPEQETEGVYEPAPDAESPLALHFSFDADGSGFTVTVPQDSTFLANGHYTRIDDTVRASEAIVMELLRQLPTAVTSLNANLGAYTMECSESEEFGGSFQVKAVFNDSGETLASFLVPMDLTCVLRTDVDPEPILIWGSTESLPQD